MNCNMEDAPTVVEIREVFTGNPSYSVLLVSLVNPTWSTYKLQFALEFVELVGVPSKQDELLSCKLNTKLRCW